jgi:hypothetical protein
MPSVEETLLAYIDALGGDRELRQITSRITVGTLQLGGDQSSFETSAKAPNKWRTVIKSHLTETYVEAFDGTTRWVSDPIAGPSKLGPAAVEEAKLYFDFYRELRLRELYPDIRVEGTSKVGERDAVVLIGTNAGNSTDRFSFFVDSGHLTKLTRSFVNQYGSTYQGDVFYSDYREVGPLFLPFKVEIYYPGGTRPVVMQSSSIMHPDEIVETLFAYPAV